MKIKHINRGYTLFLTEHEFKLLQRMRGNFDIEEHWPHMNTGERRSWSRRIRHGEFLRVDTDARTVKDY